ncbi:MAG TPA: hypothetical protein VL092_10585 [Chitinophagaceae bacterium]|nr:hypothetical protein [Chitinophagaceae bacterium]
MKIRLLLVLLFVLHTVIACFRPAHTPMWDDEASVVWFAKNYNKYGSIVGYDGNNIFSYRNGQLINEQLEYNNPPLDIYYTAFILRHFGDSDVVLRLSFIVWGIAALFLFLCCLRLIEGKDKVWFLYSAVLLLLSVNYLMIETNTRYYAFNFFFAALSLWATLKMAEEPLGLYRKTGILVLQLIALYFLFLSHYLAAVCWWIMCFYIMYRKDLVDIGFRKRFTWVTLVLNLTLAAVFVYYLLAHQSLNRPDMISADSLPVKYAKLTEWLIMDLHNINLVPLWTIPVFLYLFFFRKRLLSPEFRMIAASSLVFLLAMLLLNPQSTSESLSFDIRYLYVIIPLLSFWIGYLLKLLHEQVKNGPVLAIFSLLIFVNTSLFSAIPSSGGPRILLPNLIKEKLHPYPTAYAAALDYIKTHFKGRKKILTLPGYHNTVFLRYVPDKIEITNTLDTSSPLSRRLTDSLDMPCLWTGACKPEYVFQFGTTETLEDYPIKAGDFAFVDTIMIYAQGLDLTRPELYWHSFGPKKVTDPRTEALYIYHD